MIEPNEQASTERFMTSRQMAWFRFRRNPSAIIGATIVISVIMLAIFAPIIAPSPQSAGSFVDFAHRHHPPTFCVV